MGHKSGDAVYWTHYRNEISAIDFQAIRANVDAEDVSILSSIALASRPGAPTSLSPEGFRTVYENPELKTLLLRESDLLDSLLSKHLTLDIARTEAPWEMQRLEELQQQILRVKFRLRTQTYREEYQAFVEAPCEITRPPEKGPDDAGLGTTVVDDCASAKLREHDHEMICLPLRRSPSDTTSLPLEDGGSVDDYDGKFTNIDPTLLEEDAQQHVEDYLAEGQADIGDDHANDDFCDDEHSDEDHVILTQKRVSQTGKAKTLISPWHLGGDISAAMFSEDSEMEIPLGNKMVDFFNHLHPIDSFFPGQEPLPGTLACRFCNETMILQHAVGHARACAKKLALRQCISVLETHFTVLEQCSWVNRLGKRCGKTGFKSHVDVANHIGSHYNCYKDANGLKANICQLSPCNEATTPVIYGAPAAWVQHLITVHRIPGAQSKTGDAYIHWCGLCGRWLCQLVEDLDDHVSNHEEMIGDLIRTEGFTGARVGRTTIRPPLNPFQLFDISLRPSARFHLGYNNTNDVNVHIADYVENLDDDVRLACPASADAGEHIRAVCYETAPMRKEELCLHMEKAHGLKPRVRPDKKKKRALHADVDKASKVEKGKATADKKKKRMLQADDDEASKAKKGKATADEKKKRMLQADDDEASKAKKGKATADEKKRVLQADDDESSKVKKGKPSRSMPTLAPRSINANIGAAMRSNASAYLTKH